MQLHKELKSSHKLINSNDNQTYNQYDRKAALNYIFNEFKKEISIISDLFFGFNEIKIECLNCKTIYNSQGLNSPISYNYEIFNCLIFPLEEIKNMKNSLIQYNNIQINNNRVTLYDCFLYNQKTEIITGYCNNCKQIFDSKYTSMILSSPLILIIILERGKGNIYDIKLECCEEIDITQFVQYKNTPQLYELYGVISLIGQIGPNQHFVASCRSPINYIWYRYNDALVNRITDLQKEVIEFGVPYILFYQKRF